MDVRVLGPIAVSEGDEELVLGGPRQRRLLAALLLADGRPASAERLAAAVWGDEPEVPDAGPRTVQSYVSRLRSALGDDRVVGRDGGYVLVPDGLTVDAERFRADVDAARVAPPERAVALLDAGLALWRGLAFGEFAAEPWARPAAAGLEELRLVALELRAQMRLDSGGHAEAVPELEELVAAHPLRERFRAQLMLALYRGGRQAEALRSFQDHRWRLADETGLEPSRDLVELDRRISLADPSLAFVTPGRAKRGYVLADVIGEGAFGTVYRAVQPSVGREVAVKVIRPELADDPEYVRRFEGEARLVARLEHAHIVPLYDFWREPGGAYLVFRLLRGGSLEARRATDGPWSLEAVDRLVGEVGSALAVAHAAGVVHRDVKPANVLFDEAGDSYLADFGIALSGGADAEADGLRSAGSPLYASPEQVRDGVATARSDQYALAVVAWELLAGVAPFDADRVTTLLRLKLERTVPPLGTRRADVSEAVDAVLHRAAAVHPDDRFSSMAEFLAAWREAVRRPARASVTTGELRAPETSLTATLTRLGLEVTNPYQGLRAFDEGDAARFHGRAAEVDALAALVDTHRFVAVVGPSGSGKSSLVRAGLAPRLRDAGCVVVTVIPGANPVDELADALVQVAVAPFDGVRGALLDPERIGAALSAMLPAGAELIIVLDQFEELWTLVDAGVRDALLRTLVAVAADGPVRIVATIRADFYDRPLAHREVGELVRDATFALTPLGPAELERAITAPATAVGVRLEAPLVAELVADAAAHPASLPLLQYALTELFDRRDGATMTLAAYRSIGGLAGAISARAEALHDEIPLVDRPAVRRLFTRLVTPGEGIEDTRRRARRSELAGVAVGVVDAYGAARLLTFDVDPSDREPTVEVAHEALIRHWPRLRAWLDEDRDGLRVHRQLADAAASWDVRGRDVGDLYRGARLETAREWLAGHTADASPIEATFVREAERRVRRGRRLARAAVGALAVLVIAALLAASLAVVQRRRADRNAASALTNASLAAQRADEAAAQTARAEGEREEADLRRLVADAQASEGHDLARALLLAREANLREDSARTIGALQAALTSNPTVLGYLGSDGTGVWTVDVSRDLTTLVTGRYDGTVERWDLGTRRRIERIGPFAASPVAAAIDPSGTVIVVGRPDGTYLSWEVAAHAVRDPSLGGLPPRPAVSPTRPVWLAGAGFLLLAGPDVMLAPLDGSPRTIHRSDGVVEAMVVSPDGSAVVVAVGHDDGRTTADVLDRESFARRAVVTLGTGIVGPRLAADPQAAHVAIASTGPNSTLQIVDVATGAVTGRAAGDQENHMPVYRHDGTELLTPASGGDLVRRDPVTAQQRGGLERLFVSTADVRMSDDGARLYVGSADGRVAIVSLTGETPLSRPLAGAVGGATISPDGRRVTVVGPDGALALFDVATGANQWTVRLDITPEFQLTFSMMAHFSPDGGTVAVGSLHDRIELFDTASGRHRTTLDVPPIHIPASTLKRPGLFDGALWTWGWTPDGTGVFVARWDSVVLVDVATGAARYEVTGLTDHVTNVAVSDDGGLVVAADFRGKALTFDARTGVVRSSRHGYWAWFLPGTQTQLLTDYFTRTTAFVEALSGDAVRRPLTTVGLEIVMAASEDGQTLFFGGQHRVRMYDRVTGRQVGDGFPQPGGFALLSLTDHGRRMVTSAASGPVTIWNVDAGSWADVACRTAGRNLTQDEWQLYLPPGEAYRSTCPDFPTGK